MPENRTFPTRTRLDDLGGRIARVAHELNGPLSLIAGSIENLDHHLGAFVRYVEATEDRVREDPVLGDRFRESGVAYAAQNAPRLMALCGEGVQRLRHILEQLKGYAGQPVAPRRREEIDVDVAIRRAVRMAGQERTNLPVVEVQLDNPPRALGDPDDFGQVLTNLLTNAFDAVAGRENSRVWISACPDETRSRVEVRVRDNGPGVPAANGAVIFEPFFTTKARGAGLGLGLAIAREAIEAQGGALSLDDTTGEGAEFVLYMPAAPAHR